MEIRPKKESQTAQPWILYLPARGSLIDPASGEGGREHRHCVQDQVEVALGSVGHNRNHSLQPERNRESVPAQALRRGQRQQPGRTLQQGGIGSNGEIKEARSRPPSPPEQAGDAQDMSITSPGPPTAPQGLSPGGSSAPALGRVSGPDKLPGPSQEPCRGKAEREEAEPEMQSRPDLSGEGWPQTDPTAPGSRRGRLQCQAVASRWGSPAGSAFWGRGKGKQ